MPKLIARYRSSINLRTLLVALKTQSIQTTPLFTESGFNTSLYRSAADALHAYLNKYSIRGKIIVPAYTCERVVSALISAGSTPYFIDVDLHTGVASPMAIVDACRQHKPAAIIATHIFGHSPQFAQLMSYCRTEGIRVIEDAALSVPTVFDNIQSQSTTNHPDATILSFGKGKLFSLGLGGLLIDYLGPVDMAIGQRKLRGFAGFNELLALAIYASPLWRYQVWITSHLKSFLRYKNAKSSFQPKPIYGNRLSPLAARLVNTLVTKQAWDHNLQHRHHINQVYLDNISPCSLLRTPVITEIDTFITPHYPIFTPQKMALHHYLAQRGFDTAIYFDYCIGRLATHSNFPNAERFAREVLLLPNHIGITTVEARELAQTINQWAASH